MSRCLGMVYMCAKIRSYRWCDTLCKDHQNEKKKAGKKTEKHIDTRAQHSKDAAALSILIVSPPVDCKRSLRPQGFLQCMPLPEK
jgi:hypothetical protein